MKTATRFTLAAAACATVLTAVAVRGHRPRSRPHPINRLPEAERSGLTQPPPHTTTTSGRLTAVMPREAIRPRTGTYTDMLLRVLAGLRALDS